MGLEYNTFWSLLPNIISRSKEKIRFITDMPRLIKKIKKFCVCINNVIGNPKIINIMGISKVRKIVKYVNLLNLCFEMGSVSNQL